MLIAENTDPILNPTLHLGFIEWREPVTTLTDFMVALVAMYGFYRFFTYEGEKSTAFKTYQNYFVFLAIGMTSAAFIGHGLQAYLSPAWKAIGWVLSTTGQLFLVLASINQLAYKWSYKLRHYFKTAMLLKYFVFLAMVFIPATRDFRLVQINSSIDLVGIVLPLQFIFYKDTKIQGSLIVIIGLLYAIIPGFIFSNQISLDKWFNYHDISHVLMCIYMFFMFFGTFNMSTHPEHLELEKTNN